jgi:hypothetical protein
MRGMTRVWVIGLLLLAGGCAGPLGLRAQKAAQADDAERFEELMAEAQEGPQFPGDRPVQTVLTHFMALADHPRFLEILERWRAQGWVPDESSCAIERARYQALKDKDPKGAQGAVEQILTRARDAARSEDKSWEVEACIDGAPFLTLSSTAALTFPMSRAADPEEPALLREWLLRAMSTVYLDDADTLLAEGKAADRASAQAAALAQLRPAEARLGWILAQAEDSGDTALIARGTAFAALEVERVSLSAGERFLARTASASAPLLADLTWAWVRALKAKTRIARFNDLALWSRDVEPEADAFWYWCRWPDDRGIAVRVPERASDPAWIAEKHCQLDGAPAAAIEGPFPLAASGQVTPAGHKLKLKKRLLLDAVPRRGAG